MNGAAEFDSTKKQLHQLLKDIAEGKIQLPDFQRGWVWDDHRIRSLLGSVAKSYPIGTLMMQPPHRAVGHTAGRFRRVLQGPGVGPAALHRTGGGQARGGEP